MTSRVFAKSALSDVAFTPFWLDDPARPDPVPPLDRDTDADLLIVGGGFTGLWAAIQAKEADPGRDVVLIEATRIAQGASGRPGGVVSTSLMHGLGNAERLFPDDMDALEELGRDNLQGFRETLARFNIDAHDDWGGELTVAVGPDALPAIRKEYDLHVKYGHRAQLLDKAGAQAEIKSPLFLGACWNQDNSGTVHPARLAWGLDRAARSLGVRVYEGTALQSVDRQGAALLVRTPGGRIRAHKVLLATNAFAAGHRRIKHRVVCIRDRVLATEPLSAGQMAEVGWANRQGVYDTRTQLRYMRLTRDNRIIFGGRLAYAFNGHRNTDPAIDHRPEPFFRVAEAFHRRFPQLGDVRFTHAWAGPIALTTRMAVHFQRYHDGDMIWAGGYSGFGVSTSRFGARVGLGMLDRVALPELSLPFATTLPTRVPPEPFRWLGAALTIYAIDTADEKGGWRNAWLRLVNGLGFPLT